MHVLAEPLPRVYLCQQRLKAIEAAWSITDDLRQKRNELFTYKLTSLHWCGRM